jgi:hypothetical protein
MFLFGLFSTNIPYIIIACIYILGFGVYSGNSIKEKLFHKTYEPVYVSVEKHDQASSNTTFHYYNKVTFIKQDIERQKSICYSYALFEIIQICHPEHLKADVYLQTFNFSRPPPRS